MDKVNKGYSVQQNISGENHRVVGGNIIHGDATFNIQSSGEEKTKPKSAAAVTASSMGKLDSEVERMLTKHELMCLKQVFAEEELDMEDLAEFNEEDLTKIGIKKWKHRKIIMNEVKTWNECFYYSKNAINLHEVCIRTQSS